MSDVVKLFGIPVAKVTEAEAVERVVALAREGRDRRNHPVSVAQERDPPRAAFVATLNVDFVCNAVRGWPFGGNDELWGYLKRADLVTADEAGGGKRRPPRIRHPPGQESSRGSCNSPYSIRSHNLL